MERKRTAVQPAISAETLTNALSRLNLTDDQMAALSTQGFVARERRCGRRDIFKLRFRIEGKQVVRSLGTSPANAASVALAVRVLQRTMRVQRELRKLEEELRRYLKATKKLLRPAVDLAGYRFHGMCVRRTRSRSDLRNIKSLSDNFIGASHG